MTLLLWIKGYGGISHTAMQCCGGCWGRGNQLSLSSSFSLATERNPHVVTESYRSQVLRGFLFLEEQTSFCSSRFCFCPKNSNNKKAKDSGGGTPDSVGTGFNPLRCLAFSIVCCVGKTDVDNQESFHVVLAVWVSKQLVTFCMEKRDNKKGLGLLLGMFTVHL